MNVGATSGSITSGLSYCRVDGGGVPAEWVEAGTAAEGQPTLVWFLGSTYALNPLKETRARAGRLAAETGARVLTVACWEDTRQSLAASVARGITAYRWLLGEGCDLERTAFTGDFADVSMLRAIFVAARSWGLPLPAGGIRFCTAELPEAR